MQLIKLPEVLKIVPVSRAKWYKMVKSKEAPAQVRLGAKCVAWDRDEIECWLRDKKLATANDDAAQ